MAGDTRSAEDVRRTIVAEREEPAGAVDELRAGLDDATNLGARLRAKLPLVAASALGAGFVLAGGVGASMRFIARRGREGRQRARPGRFAVIDKP
jgi:hypothetical protein